MVTFTFWPGKVDAFLMVTMSTIVRRYLIPHSGYSRPPICTVSPMIMTLQRLCSSKKVPRKRAPGVRKSLNRERICMRQAGPYYPGVTTGGCGYVMMNATDSACLVWATTAKSLRSTLIGKGVHVVTCGAVTRKEDAMNCPQCGASLRPDAQFCGNCGARLDPSMAAGMPGADMAYGGGVHGGYGAGGSNEPVPQQGEPQGLLRSGDVAVRIEGELVPVVDVELGGRESVYFDHHVLLWKEPQVSIRLKPLRGAVKRMFVGL